MNKILAAHLSLLVANIIYGANFTIAKLVMPDYVKPFGFVVMRVVGALTLFWITHLLFVREKVEKKDIIKMALLAMCGVATNQLLFLKGLSLSTPINAAIIMISNPIIVLVFAMVFLKEKIRWNKILGIALGISGALMLLLMRGDFTFGSETIKGDLCVLVNSASWAMFLVFVKPLMKKYNTITIMKWIFFFGLFYVTPFGFTEIKEVDWANIPTYIWWCILSVVVATTFVAYLLNIYALKELSPGVVSAYIYLQPFLASLIAIVGGKDEITPLKIVSALFIFAGVYFISMPAKFSQKAGSPALDYFSEEENKNNKE